MRRPSTTRAQQAGIAGGALAVAAGAGVAAEHYAVRRVRRRPDPAADEPFFQLPADRTRTVLTEDGVRLHVEEVGPVNAALTLVFVHGYVNEMAVWHYQRKDLAADNPGNPVCRLVFYDQRSHGRSSRSRPEGSTIDQLGRDLDTVLTEVAPRGPVVLIGHSMGGMTIMALADQRPELFGSRVAAVALLSTSTGRLASVTFGLPALVSRLSATALPWVARTLRQYPAPFELGRRLSSDLAFFLTRRHSFGTRDISPAVVAFVERMTNRTPVDVIAEFYDTFTSHDKLRALAVLAGVPTLILVGSEDVVTPLEHSRVMADEVPTATLFVVEGAGHMVMLERPELVTDELRALVARAAAARSRSA